MIEALRRAGYDGVVYVPESSNGDWNHSYTDQIEWEQRYLNRCDLIIAWVPRDLKTMPAFTTNVEFGQFVTSGRLLYGRPNGAPKTQYLDVAYKQTVLKEPLESIEALATEAVQRLGAGALRTGGECSVPLSVWRTAQFQAWHKALSGAGNRLDDAQVLWAFFVGGKKEFLFSYTMKVKVWVATETRHKVNEYVFSRTDTSSIIPFYRGDNPNDPKIILVKEFRSPGRTQDGFVHELPGGSSFKPGKDPNQVASEELHEETGLAIAPERFTLVSTRQLCATLSTHCSHVFGVELTKEEYEMARFFEESNLMFGVLEDSEITSVECRSVSEILNDSLLDWSNIGMIMSVLNRAR
jgi:8-oxo-dGTP pyrophosphatase MutT (NUDIX family)